MNRVLHYLALALVSAWLALHAAPMQKGGPDEPPPPCGGTYDPNGHCGG